MRIGIDYRIVAVGPELITRGMGRFTQQQMREVLRVDTENEYVLLCNRGTDLSLIDAGVRDAENVFMGCFDVAGGGPRESQGYPGLMRRAERYQEWIHRQDLDVYHATTPFLDQDPLLVQFDACPMVATFYDLIPLLYADQYLTNAASREQYYRDLHFLQDATRLLAISHSAREDACTYLSFDRSRVDVAWPIPDDVFRRLTPNRLEKMLMTMRGRIRVPQDFVLTVTYPHYTKNLTTLLRAYASFPQTVRTRLPLVICCHLGALARAELQKIASEFGIADDTILTGVVSDAELCALYNQATVFVHPSRYEGFGLPVAEAMTCGAPVVTTTTSSLPEVAGDAALLVHPDDAAGFADAILRLFIDAAARDALRARGYEQARKFSPQQLAAATLDSYREAVQGLPAGAAIEGGGRLRVAMWTPLPPQQTGIADYSAELIDELRSKCDLEAFVGDEVLPPNDLFEHVRIQHFTAFERRNAQNPFDAIVYQIGSSDFHRYIADALPRHPGIVVLHDLLWTSVLYDEVWRNGDREALLSSLADVEGPGAVRELVAAEENRCDLWPVFFKYPMLQKVIDPSLGVIVHLEDAARELAAGYPGHDTWTVPMGVVDPYDFEPGIDRDTARDRVHVNPSQYLIGVFGIVHEAKRIKTCIRALEPLVARGVDASLLVVGRFLDDGYRDELRALATECGVESKVRFTGQVEQTEFQSFLIASDVVVNLRAPIARHMSAALLRGLSAGRPVIVTKGSEWAFVPDECCLRVPLEGDEVTALADVLQRLWSDESLRNRMSSAARAYYLKYGTVEAMAARYLEVIEAVSRRGTAEGVTTAN